MKKILFSLALLAITAVAFAQGVLQPTVPDEVYTRENYPKRKVIPYTPLREADVMWSKRVWRIIDLKEKINHPLLHPTEDNILNRKSLFRYIREAAEAGNLTLYGQSDEEFITPMTKSEIEGLFVSWDSTKYAEDPVTNEMVLAPQKNELKSGDVVQYRLKEIWFFDKQKSYIDVRILGIAAFVNKRNESGEIIGVSPKFWVYFPEARNVLANTEVFNRQNDSERRTYEDIFWKRQFSSVIYKVSNVYDRAIIEYKTGLDALLEAEAIKDDIFKTEHDLWHF